MAVKTDCFAYRKWCGGSCAALTKLKCDDCKFYKPEGTECDSCNRNRIKECNTCQAARRNVHI